MGNNNKSYRIRTTVGREADSFIDVHLDQDYDSLEILSLKISDKDVYKLHNSDYGVVVGRVLANGNFGVPNAKISVFIPADEQNEDMKMWNLYPYTSTTTKNDKNIRYNLLPDESVKDCHKAVGTFPNKTYLLENDSLLEVFDKYYVYTTRTNAAGDYLICGVPTGMQTLHMDLDLSDCGILSQRPRDFVYKGYTIEQFENPNQFKKDENIDGLSQIFSQNQPVYVKPFWGNEDNGDEIGITRADIEISFKFEPTCVFMGSAISDNPSNGVGKKCVPTNQMGAMDELTAGEGTIEMIRKTPDGNVEEFSIKGNQLINGNGVWCYQIPMNLDYMMTDEYGNMVPTDDPEKGIPTRTRVRFRASLTDMEGSSQSYYRAKYLIPNNPGIDDQKVDYDFGTYTDEDSYRDLFWNGVYTVKSYIPRFQKSKRWKNERFSGIKACNYYGGNNPMPYNNLRIKLPFMFTVLCIFVKLFIKIVSLVNRIIAGVIRIISGILDALVTLILAPIIVILKIFAPKEAKKLKANIISSIVTPLIEKYGFHCTFIGDGLCPDMEGWYFAPGCGKGIKQPKTVKALMNNTLYAALGNGDAPGEVEKSSKDTMSSTDYTDETSTDVQNASSSEEDIVCLTIDVDYLVNCFEMNLAQEYRVIKFDFYNDWVNGVLYFPRWMRKIKRKKKYKFSLRDGITAYYKDKIQGCMNSENSRVKKSRYYTQQCSIGYGAEKPNVPWTDVKTEISCYGKSKTNSKKIKIFPSKCHKKQGMERSSIFGKKSGLVTERTTMLGQNVYYLKPCEWKDTNSGSKVRTLLFATDIILLGTLNDCDENGLPQSFKYLNNSSYIMPTNLALTTMDDDAYIYTNKEGTVCSSSKSLKKSEEETVLRVTPSYESTYSAYTKTDGDAIEYEENDDPIPVTEAAGINWNYSGPGQDIVDANEYETPTSFIRRLFSGGNKRYHYLYYPGGHFLGLSCTNSETNIKSCVNLKRICEMGATMSQRREELRGYNQENGTPLYRYYVPTGLISNVDIEGAAFRSMFATMNHNKLVATVTSDTTGYKKYGFRFLRPDGFDGALANYVHKANSPYNRFANEDGIHNVSDATNFFEKIFAGIWSRPDDYDPQETAYTETRTVEDSVDDYYMFRFGLDTFSDKEQKKHYLKHYNGMHSMPQYENSFYFYFGLKDGSTALDEFKKQFFSECEANNIMNSPNISVKEKIREEDLKGSATLIIDNMLPNYTIIIKDNTLGTETQPFVSAKENIDIGSHISPQNNMIIGHEYTVIVTDSLDQTLEKTFVFGASAVRVDASTVHFRKEATNNRTDSGTQRTRNGGYIKINNSVVVLKKSYEIDNPDTGRSISMVIKNESDQIVATINSSSQDKYTDASGEKWFLAYVPKIGTYNVFINYNNNLISIFTSVFEDNQKINLYVACDYLSYKPDKDIDGNMLPSAKLSALTQSDWLNGTPFRGNTWNNWLMRHTFYRQTEDDNAAFDSYIYSSTRHELAIFGQGERNGLLGENGLPPEVFPKPYPKGLTFYRGNYDMYQGYSIDDEYSFIPTMYWNPTSADTYPNLPVRPYDLQYRNTFDAMSYSEDGRSAADALSARITSYNYNDGTITLGYNYFGGPGRLNVGHGCIVVFEDGTIIYPVVDSTSQMTAHYPYNIYPDNTATEELLNMATIYPTMIVPVIYKPLYGEVCAVTWNVQTAVLGVNEDNEAIVEIENLPLSYQCDGTVYNGLTFDNHFFKGVSPEEEDVEFSYDTFLINENDSYFYDNLTADTRTDWMPRRELPFHLGREFIEEDDKVDNEEEFIYAVKENIPDRVANNIPDNVYTGRYEDGFDQTFLSDSCGMSDTFYENLKIKLYNEEQEKDGPCTLYTAESLKDDVKYYVTKTPVFLESIDPLSVAGGKDDDATSYIRAVYNKNATYDKKGSAASLKYTFMAGRFRYFEFSLTQSDGTKVSQVISNATTQDLYERGITVAHSYTLLPQYKNGTDTIASLLRLSTTKEIDISTSKSNGTIFDGGEFGKISDYDAVIAVYNKPFDGTRNKLTIYRIYPVKGFELIYPISSGGIDPYLNPDTGGTYSSEAQSAVINVATNISYKVTSNANWASVSNRTFDARDKNITVSLTENQDHEQSSRTATITFTSIDKVKVSDSGELDYITATTTIVQLKNSVSELENDINVINDNINDINDRIDDSTPPEDNGN